MSKWNTLKEAIKSFQVGRLVWNYLMNHLRISVVKNNNIWYLQKQDITFRKLKKKYAYVLTQEVSCEERIKANTIWILWLQGEQYAPPLVKACINSVKQNAPKKMEIIVLDEKIIRKYVDFPNEIWEKREKGIIPNAQFSDLVRIDLLCRYGGIWIDSTVLCTGYDKQFEYIANAPLFVYKDMDLIKQDWMPTIASNWLISAYSNSKILLMTRKLLFEYWKKNNRLVDYYIFHFFFAFSVQKYMDEWDEVEMYNNKTPHTMQAELGKKYNYQRWNQLINMSCFHKLNRYVNYENIDNSFYMYIIKKYAE